jgi:hypothetical protein
MESLTFSYHETLIERDSVALDESLVRKVAAELTKHIEAEFVKACGVPADVLAMRSTLVSLPNGEFYTVTTRRDERGVYLGCMVNVKGLS